MIKNLRSRFIRIVMESFLVVLLLILIGVNLINTRNVYAGIDSRLDYLAESAMGPPVGMVMSTPEEIRSWVDLNSAGIMNESSYFIFSGAMTGPILDHQLEVLSAATELDAAALIGSILADPKTRGDVGQYRYFVAERSVPYKLVFLRCETEFTAIRSLWQTSVLVGLISFLLVLLMVTLLSGRVIRPFAQNIESQRRFISNASHELKTPLGVIISDLDMQIMEDGKSSEWLENAQLQADHLSLLIDQLTTYSLLNEKKQDAAALPVDISALGEGILSDFRPLALSKGQTLEADIEPGVSVPGNEDALRTLMSVLMDNAVKYAPEGGCIRLSIRREKKAVIQLTNTCGDLSDIDLTQIFERFYRAPGHRASQEGHGLGLSIAQEIASLYGGSIRAEGSADGRSVTFTAEIG